MGNRKYLRERERVRECTDQKNKERDREGDGSHALLGAMIGRGEMIRTGPREKEKEVCYCIGDK